MIGGIDMTQIIFNSQEEFEDAVMDVIKQRLSIAINAESQFDSDMIRLEVTLGDYTGTVDYFTSDSATV